MIIRKVLPHELGEAAALSDFVFRQPDQQSMGKIFPYLFNPGISHSYAAFTEEGKMVAFMGLVPEVIRIGKARLNAFGLGSVCTHPDYRGQNIASRLLEECKEHAKRSGASLVFISGARSLYTRSGCRHFGKIEYAALNRATASDISSRATGGWTVRSMVPEDTFAVSALLSSAHVGYEQGPTQLLSLLGASAIPDIFRLDLQALVGVKDGEIQAFAAGAVHNEGHSTASSGEPSRAVEWAGDVQGCALLFAEMLNRFPAEQIIIPIPWQENELIGLLKASGAEITASKNSGTVWIVSTSTLLSQCAPLLPSQAFRPGSSSDHTGSCISTKDGQEIELDESELLTLLFDPESPHKTLIPENFKTIPLPYLSNLHFI